MWQFAPQTGDKCAKNAEISELVFAFRHTLESGAVNTGELDKDRNQGGYPEYTASNRM